MKQRETKTTGIPDIREDNLADVVRAIKATLEIREGRSGDALDQNVTLRHLTALGLADADGTTKVAGGDDISVGPPGSGPGDGYNPGGDLSTPPAPEGLEVHPAGVMIGLGWIGASYRNHAFTEIWRNSQDQLSSAVMIGTSPVDVYADPVDFDSTYWYWIRFVSKADVRGPYNSQSGTMGHTMIDSDKAILALSGAIVNSPLWATMSQRVAKIETNAIVANRGVNSSLQELNARADKTSSRLLSLQSVNATQATRLEVLESRGPSGNRTFFAPERPDASTPGVVGGVSLLAGDVWYDTDDSNRSYRWSGTLWVEFVATTGTKVYHQPTDPAVSNNGTDWFDAAGRALRDGDLWYDSDSLPTPNHPYLWNTVSHAWVDVAGGGDNSAAIATLEQTKIGYATLDVTSTLGVAGSVYDGNGLVWNNVEVGATDSAHSVKTWNTTHNNTATDSKLTWHIGLPFAQSTKQVGVVAGDGSNSTVQQQFTVMQNNDKTLLAQYTVKIDTNGYVAGFGLAQYASVADGTTSIFMVNADKFAIGPVVPPNFWSNGQTYAKNAMVKQNGGAPLVTHVFQSLKDGNLNNPPKFGSTDGSDKNWVDLTVRLPFIATSSAQTINGVSYPPGVWMNAAHITEASINDAQIVNLNAYKIDTGTLRAFISVDTGKIYGGINPANPIGSSLYGTGFFLGNDGGTQKFYVGTNDVAYVMWDGSGKLNILGDVYATGGQIGGINMFATGKRPNLVGQLFAPAGVTGLNTGAPGFWLDSTAKFRIGKPTGTRMQWDGTTLGIYDDNNKLVMASGTLDWSAISNVPTTVQNSTVRLNSDGTLTGGSVASQQVTPAGIHAINTDGSGAPPTLINSNVVLSGSNGVIQLSGGSGQVTQVVMPGFRIGDPGHFTGTFIANAAIDTAQIANLAVGGAQIANAVIATAHIADLQVTTFKIGDYAVMIPSTAGYSGVEPVQFSEVVLFGGPIQGGAVVSFTLDAASPVINVLFVTELYQADPTDGGSCLVTCYLNRRTDNALIGTRGFTVGIINNQPNFAQTACFTFIGVAAGSYYMHISAKQISGGGGKGAMMFGQKTLTVAAHKK